MSKEKSKKSGQKQTAGRGAVSPESALVRLRKGNKRFVKRRTKGVLNTKGDIRKLMLKSRDPFAIILSCSDSRAPSEIIFDQGLGDLFVIRVAGNIVAPSLVGSVEFAAATTKARLVVVVGHTYCGAIQTTYDVIEGRGTEISENVRNIVDRIRPHVSPIIKKEAKKPTKDILRSAMRANVLASANHLRYASQLLEKMITNKELVVVGAEYDIETGVVDFFDVPK